MNLEAIPRSHTSTYLCTLLECYGDVPLTNMGGGNFHHANIEPKHDGALDIHVNAFVISYLQTIEILVGLTPKE